MQSFVHFINADLASLLLDANMQPTALAIGLAVAVKFVWAATLIRR